MLRVGRATDSTPISFPSVVARKERNTGEDSIPGVRGTGYVEAVSRPKPATGGDADQKAAEPAKKEGRVTRKSKAKGGAKKVGDDDADEAMKNAYEVKLDSDDPVCSRSLLSFGRGHSLRTYRYSRQFDQKLAALQISLRDRMRFYKLAVEPQGTQIAASFNTTHTPEIVPEAEDPEYLRVKESLRERDVLVGDEVRLISHFAT